MGIFDFFKDKSSRKFTNDNLSLEQKYKIALETDRLNNLGVTEYRNGNIREAIDYYKKALEIMPENDDSLINLAMCYIKLGDFDKAITLCKEAIKIDPKRAEGYRTIGDVYYRKSKWDEVVKWYRESALRGDQSTKNWLLKNGYSLTD